MTTLIKWLSRLAIAWSLIWVSFSVGCVVRKDSGASISWHVAMIFGHTVLLVINTQTLLRQRMNENSPNESES